MLRKKVIAREILFLFILIGASILGLISIISYNQYNKYSIKNNKRESEVIEITVRNDEILKKEIDSLFHQLDAIDINLNQMATYEKTWGHKFSISINYDSVGAILNDYFRDKAEFDLFVLPIIFVKKEVLFSDSSMRSMILNVEIFERMIFTHDFIDDLLDTLKIAVLRNNISENDGKFITSIIDRASIIQFKLPDIKSYKEYLETKESNRKQLVHLNDQIKSKEKQIFISEDIFFVMNILLLILFSVLFIGRYLIYLLKWAIRYA